MFGRNGGRLVCLGLVKVRVTVWGVGGLVLTPVGHLDCYEDAAEDVDGLEGELAGVDSEYLEGFAEVMLGHLRSSAGTEDGVNDGGEFSHVEFNVINDSVRYAVIEAASAGAGVVVDEAKGASVRFLLAEQPDIFELGWAVRQVGGEEGADHVARPDEGGYAL